MTPRLRVLVGPDPSSLTPISSLVNSGKAHPIRSDAFEGEIAVNIRGFPGSDEGNETYFSAPERKGVTWSIQAHGRFLQPHSADDVLFGNVFDKSLNLPWGSGPALKLMKYIDPTLEHDLSSSTHPWALSPLISTMPYLALETVAAGARLASGFSAARPIAEDTSSLTPSAKGGSTPATPNSTKDAEKRRTYFRDATKRKEVTFGPENVLTVDFCYGYLEFHPGLALKLPGGVSLDLTRHWDGQQVRFVCCERGTGGVGAEPYGRMFWCVAIEPVEDGEEDNDQAEEVKPKQGGAELSGDID